MALSVVFPLYTQQITTYRISEHAFALKGNRHFVIPLTYDNEGNIANSFLVTASSGLNVTVNAGQAIVGGYYVEENTNTTLSVPANTTSYVYVQIVTDAQNRATSAQYVVSTNSNLEDKKTMLIAQVTTSSSSVTSIVDRRQTSGYIRAFYIETSTSTTLTFDNARGVYAFFEGLGGGGGGARNGTVSGTTAFGGVGGGYGRNEGVFPNCVKVVITVGAGGSGGNTGSSGASGGNTTVVFQDKNNNNLGSFTAPAGAGGLYFSGSTGGNIQTFNWYGISGTTSDVSNTTRGCWQYNVSDGFQRYSFFGRTRHWNNNNFAVNDVVLHYGGGQGATHYNGSTPQTYNPFPSAFIWGGAGGNLGQAGQAPAGGGGAGNSSTSAGSGASGAVRLYLLVFY